MPGNVLTARLPFDTEAEEAAGFCVDYSWDDLLSGGGQAHAGA